MIVQVFLSKIYKHRNPKYSINKPLSCKLFRLNDNKENCNLSQGKLIRWVISKIIKWLITIMIKWLINKMIKSLIMRLIRIFISKLIRSLINKLIISFIPIILLLMSLMMFKTNNNRIISWLLSSKNHQITSVI